MRRAGRPSSRATASVVTAIAAAPSEIPHELPAVTVPVRRAERRAREAGARRRPASSDARGRLVARDPADRDDLGVEAAAARGAALAQLVRARRPGVLPRRARCRAPRRPASAASPISGSASRSGRTAHGCSGGLAVAVGRPEPPRRRGCRLRPAGEHELGVARAHDAGRLRDGLEPEPHCRSTVTAGHALRRARRAGAETPGDVAAGAHAVAEHDLVDGPGRCRHLVGDRAQNGRGESVDAVLGEGRGRSVPIALGWRRRSPRGRRVAGRGILLLGIGWIHVAEGDRAVLEPGPQHALGQFARRRCGESCRRAAIGGGARSGDKVARRP